uniref:Uncharacterized protein n=1 Tax=Desulfatirhabdium butyrativorans TaxID=340467 RepID=A0A7C4W030_9BACT
MKKKYTSEIADELRSEYDLYKLLKGGVRGKYVVRYRAGTNLVLLDPDVAKAFPDEDAVNETLRLVIRLSEIQQGKKNIVAKA